jgi:hypothetical protein
MRGGCRLNIFPSAWGCMGGLHAWAFRSDACSPGTVALLSPKELAEELGDPKSFGSRGEAWFFAQIATFILILFPPIPLQGLVDLLGTLSMAAGVVFAIYALLSLGRNLSPMPAPRKNHQLVTSGM